MRLLITFVLLLGCSSCLSESVVVGTLKLESDAVAMVLDWNQALMEVAETEDGLLTLKGVRTAAMVHIAMHDVLSATNNEYVSYTSVKKNGEANPLAAMTQAAYEITSNMYSDQKQRFEKLNVRWLRSVSEGSRKENGKVLGAEVGRRIMHQRTGDGWDTEADYQWHPMAPGVYAEFNEHSGTPEGFVFGAGWAQAKGFVLTSPGQFRSAPPPSVESREYTVAFNEVKRLGRFQSIDRTADETHQALWWKDFVERSHNRLARDLVRKQELELVEVARLFAMLNMSVFDAYVSSFDNKFYYNHWRPYTAIRWAANDNNPDTEADESWTNTHQHTYAFPSYPSAHGTACAAAMTAFSEVFGDDYAFSMRTETVDLAGPFSGKIVMDPSTRQFNSFSEAARECALSRLYLGIHFRYDSAAGLDLGQRVGRQVVDRLPRF